MKKFLKVTCLVFLSMSLFMSCAKKDILPEEDITVKESDENYEKGNLYDKRVKLFYDDNNIKYSSTTALTGALSKFNSTFGTTYYYAGRYFWNYSDDFGDITDACDHLKDNYPNNNYFGVAGACTRIETWENGGICDPHHFVIDWDYLGSSAKRKSCFLHEFSHIIPGMGNVRGNGKDCSSSLCVMTSRGVNCGSLTHCSNCKAIINGWLGN